MRLKELEFAIPEEKFPQKKCHKDHRYKVARADIDGESKLVMISDETEIAKIRNSDMVTQEIRKWQSHTETWGEKNKKEIEAIKRRFNEIFGQDNKGKPRAKTLGKPSGSNKSGQEQKSPLEQWKNI